MPDEEPARLATLNVIVVAIDGSELSTYALQVAKGIARAQNAKVVAVHVRHVDQAALSAAATPTSVTADEFFDAADEIAREAKDSASRVLGDAGPAQWTYEERQGQPVDSIVAAVQEHQADLVVVGSHGHRLLYQLVVGSITQGLILRAPVSVLVARPHQGGSPPGDAATE
ncbi:MAG: universal stress protein [Candidatus Dormibacteraceae bacterium]